MSTLTDEQVLETLRQVVAEVGEDHFYNFEVLDDGYRLPCVYQQDGAPRCIVGHVLARLLPDEWLGLEVVKANLTATRLGGLFSYYDAHMSGPAAHALRAAQRQQDAGKPWGEALAAAEREYAAAALVGV